MRKSNRIHSPRMVAAAENRPAHERGVVQVEFAADVPVEVLTAVNAAKSESIAAANPAGTDFVNVLESFGFKRAASPYGYPTPTASNRSKLFYLYFDSSDTETIAKALSQLPIVRRASPLPAASAAKPTVLPPLAGVSDVRSIDFETGLSRQWYLHRCAIPQVWAQGFVGQNVVIADIDFGFRTTHNELARLELANAFNSFDGSTNVSAGRQIDISHGTGVASLAVAAPDGDGMVGVAFGASLWPIQANAGTREAVLDPWAFAIDWVRRRDSGGRPKVLMLEAETTAGGNFEQRLAVHDAIVKAIDAGVIVCVAAGNGDRDASIDDFRQPIEPTRSILVGATRYSETQNRRAKTSNFGSQVVVSAPGDTTDDVAASADGDDTYVNGFGGTSGALPKVAGVIALMLSKNPKLTHADVRGILSTTGTRIITSTGKPVGSFLNATAAVHATPQPPATV